MAHAIALSSACDALLFTLSGALPPALAPHFTALAWGWLLCVGRPTVTNLLRSHGEKFNRHWTCAHRFFARYRWSTEDLFRALVRQLLDPLWPADFVWLVAADDTTAHKSGPRVAFAGYFRDPVRSTPAQTVLHWAHNWVLLCLLIPLPFARGRYLHLPVLARLYKKEADCARKSDFRTRLQLVAEMIQSLRAWLPHRAIRLVGDGAFAAGELVSGLPPGVPFVSRLRSDAALYALPLPRRKGQRGRPRKKGVRLPALPLLARRVRFARRYVWRHGRKELVGLHSFLCLWYAVAGTRPIRVLIVRDLHGHQPDDYLWSTDPHLSPVAIVQDYAARWGIEEAIREAKQSLGFEQVQAWSPRAVERQAPMALLLHALTQLAYLKTHDILNPHPPSKDCVPPVPSFARMLAALRLAKWQQRIFAICPHAQERRKIIQPLEALFLAAG